MDDTQIAFVDLINSEKANLKDLHSLLQGIFYTGVCIIAIFGSFVFIMVIPLSNHLKKIWGNLFKAIDNNIVELKIALNERIIKYHNYEDDLYPIENDTVNNKILSFSHSKHYLLRLSILVLLGIILYIASVFIFYVKVEDYMLCKLDFAQTMINRRIFVYQRTFFLTELYADYKDKGFDSLYSFSPLTPSKVGYTLMADKMTKSRRDIYSENVQKVISPRVWEELFANIEDQNGFLKYGLGSAYSDVKWESLFLSTNYENCNFYCFQFLYRELKDMIDFFNKTSEYMDKSSTVYLDGAFSDLLIFIVLSLCGLLFLIMLYFIPYFNKEMKLIKDMQINSECADSSRKQESKNKRGRKISTVIFGFRKKVEEAAKYLKSIEKETSHLSSL